MIVNYIDQIIMFGAGALALYVANLMREGRIGDKLDAGQRGMLARALGVLGPILMVLAVLIVALKMVSGGVI